MRLDLIVERLKHPHWWPRLVGCSVRCWWLWNLQGRPRDLPVVIKPGRLIASRDGRGGHITGFHLDSRYQRQIPAVDDVWDRFSAMYPVDRPGR
jgi:hypothetical protein